MLLRAKCKNIVKNFANIQMSKQKRELLLLYDLFTFLSVYLFAKALNFRVIFEKFKK